MSSKDSSSISTIEPVNGYEAGGSRRARDLARSVPATRPAPQRTSRARISATKVKPARVVPLGPTPERLAKGDIDIRIGAHRAIPPIERLRDQGKLAPIQLPDKSWSVDAAENQARYEAALKLRRHFDGLGLSVQAQDLNKVMGSSGDEDLTKQDSWVHHRNQFQEAVRVMGWSGQSPHQGAGRIVVAVVCREETVFDAAVAHTAFRQKDALGAVGMDRLREGLSRLAIHWRMSLT